MKLSLLAILLLKTSFCIAQNYKVFKINHSFYKFNLDKNQGGQSKFIEYDDERLVFIRSVERPTNAIETFSVKTGNLVSVINPKIEKIGSFKSLSANRFWIHDRVNRAYLLINSRNEILSKVKEPDFSNGLTYIMSSPYPSAPIVLHKNYIYVTGMIQFQPKKTFNLEAYKKTGIIEKLSLSGESSFIGTPTPLSLKNFYGNLNAYSLTLNKNNLIAASLFSDEIQIIDLNNFTKKNLTLKTRFANLIKPIAKNPFETTLSNFERNQLTKKSYINIAMIYDKFKNVYYRIVRFPEKSLTSIKYAIIVLDSHFKPILETEINSNIYNVGMYFITKHGLAIFNRQKYNLDNTKLTFDVFSLNN